MAYYNLTMFFWIEVQIKIKFAWSLHLIDILKCHLIFVETYIKWVAKTSISRNEF